jgi:hypothetical protein
MSNLEFEIRNSEPGGFSGELALSQSWRENPAKFLSRDSFAPYRTDFYLTRWEGSNAKTMIGGVITAVNLNKDRDTILVSGKDWIHYLERRIYPWIPEDFVHYNPDNPNMYLFSVDGNGNHNWPKRYRQKDTQAIVRDLLLRMINAQTHDGYFGPLDSQSLQILPPSSPTGVVVNYGPIYPGDETSIYDHIKAISELSDGFEFDIMPQSLEFKMWSPRRDPNQGIPVWELSASDIETNGQFIEFDWENDGPDGTFLTGLGTGRHKIGATWTDPETVRRYRWLDKLYDYGTISSPDAIIRKLMDQNDLYPQKKLALTLLNPSFLQPSFYSPQNGARNRIGAQFRVTHDFAPYHKVDAFFRINAINGSVDESTNESLTLELEMVYDPNTNGDYSGGVWIPGGKI